MALPLSRRRFAGLAMSTAAAGVVGACAAIDPPARARVVIIGGGFGGATAAKYLRLADPDIAVTLLEPNRRFITCPFSNHVLVGLRRMEDLTQEYTTLAERHGVRIVHQAAVSIDPVNRVVGVADGTTLGYDRLVVSPGIDIRWSAIDGYNENTVQRLPHAWKSGDQVLLLRRQLEAMPDGGVFVISAPPAPYRCPPGPYERASLVAHYFKRAKPRSKILILDAKDQFSEQGLFEDGWNALYQGMIEWVPLSQDGRVTEVKPAEMTLVSEFGEPHKGDVINIIPPQYAGKIARDAGLANQTGWCPVDPLTFESTIHKNVHVIGDACIAGAMPKGAFAANTQAKVAALAIVNATRGQPPATPTYLSSCYSVVAPDYGFSVMDVFRATAQGIVSVPGAGGGSRRNADAAFRAQEARYADGWYASITEEIWRS
ncbi:MAG TPA: FCSD flavin-binding domain-containing protein [Alphaproteobacteria bacterium]